MKQLQKLFTHPFYQPKLYLYIGLIVLAYLVFYDWIWELFNSLIVKLFFLKYSPKPLSDICVFIYLVIVAIITLHYLKKINRTQYKISLLTLFFILFICFIYWQNRYLGERYNYSPLVNNNFVDIVICQLDVVFLSFSCIGICLFINQFRITPYKENLTYLFQDQPIQIINEDRYKRNIFFKKLSDDLKKIAFDGRKGFSIGINGPWGFGKSSLLEIIKAELKTENDIVCLDYNSWLSAKGSNLTHDFFLMMEKELSKYVETSNLINKYAEKLSKIDDDKNPLKKISETFVDEKSLKERFEEIGEIIKRTNKRFFVIVDDLDRLDNFEVLEILRLIRNTGNFPRVNFIVAYDRHYLINALEVNKIYKPSMYLEKIFDVEILLPKIESNIILELLFDTLKTGFETMILTPDERNKIIDQLSNIIFNSSNTNSTKITNINSVLIELFDNKRDILKFTNSFLLAYSIIKTHVYLPDLFILELIKLKNPSLYLILAKNDKYLDISQVNNVKRFVFHNKEFSDIENRDIVNNAHRTGLFDIMKGLENDILYKNLVEALFELPIADDYNSRSAITFVNNFESYFINSLPSGIFGFEDLDNLIYD